GGRPAAPAAAVVGGDQGPQRPRRRRTAGPPLRRGPGRPLRRDRLACGGSPVTAVAAGHPAVDVLSDRVAVVLQDRPVVPLTAWLADAARTCAEAGRGLQGGAPPAVPPARPGPPLGGPRPGRRHLLRRAERPAAALGRRRLRPGPGRRAGAGRPGPGPGVRRARPAGRLAAGRGGSGG